MINRASLDSLFFQDPTGTMFGNIGHMVKNAYEGTIDNVLHRIDNLITEVRESIHSVVNVSKGLIGKFPNPFKIAWNSGKAVGIFANGALDGIVNGALGLVHTGQVLLHEGIDVVQGGVYAVVDGIRNTLGKIPIIGRGINPTIKGISIALGFLPTAIIRAPISISSWARESLDKLRGKTHDKVKSILEIKSEDIANDDQEVATSSPAVENQEAAG